MCVLLPPLMVCRRSNKLSFPGPSGLCNNRYGSINSTFVQLLNIGYHPKFQQQLTTVTATDKRGFARKVAALHLRTLVTVLTNNLWHSHKSRFQYMSTFTANVYIFISTLFPQNLHIFVLFRHYL